MKDIPSQKDLGAVLADGYRGAALAGTCPLIEVEWRAPCRYTEANRRRLADVALCSPHVMRLELQRPPTLVRVHRR